jgi:photosystem II Psb28-2 protein
MTSLAAIYFFEGVPEELSNVSLRRGRHSGVRSVLLQFTQLKSLERFNTFTKKFNNYVRLVDEEGEIQVTPSSTKFFFGGMDGDEFQRLDCTFEIEQEDHWERFMRFMNRYAEANGMAYSDSNK